jgi:hypothetical protein
MDGICSQFGGHAQEGRGERRLGPDPGEADRQCEELRRFVTDLKKVAQRLTR